MDKGGLGNLQQLVMLAVQRLENRAWASELRAEIKAVTGKEVAVSTVHVTLVRLESRGLVTSERGPAPERGGKPKRIFALTAEGKQSLAEARKALDLMWDGLSPDLA